MAQNIGMNNGQQSTPGNDPDSLLKQLYRQVYNETNKAVRNEGQVTDDGYLAYDFISTLGKGTNPSTMAFYSVRNEKAGIPTVFALVGRDDFIKNYASSKGWPDMQMALSPEDVNEPIFDNISVDVKAGVMGQTKEGKVPSPTQKAIYQEGVNEYGRYLGEYNNYAKEVQKFQSDTDYYSQVSKMMTGDIFNYKYTPAPSQTGSKGEISYIQESYDGRTDSEKARSLNVVYNKETGEWEEVDWWSINSDRGLALAHNVAVGMPRAMLSAWENVLNIVTTPLSGESGKDVSFWAVTALQPVLRGIEYGADALLPEPQVYTVEKQFDPNTGQSMPPYLAKQNASNRDIQSGQIYSIFSQSVGGNSLGNFGSSWFGNVWNTLGVAVTTLPAKTMSLSSEWALSATDMLLADEYKSFNDDETYNNIAAMNNTMLQLNYNPSVNAQQNPWGAEGIIGMLGASYGQGAMIALTAGIGAPSGVALSLKSMNLGIGALTVMETADFNQQLTDMGVAPEFKAMAIPVFAGMTYGVEKAIGPGFIEGANKTFARPFLKTVIKNELGVNSKSAMLRGMSNMLRGNSTNLIEAMGGSMLENMPEEFIQQVGKNIILGAQDLSYNQELFMTKNQYHELNDRGMIAGTGGTFFDSKADDSWMKTVFGNSFDGALEAGLQGAIAGPMMMLGRGTFVGMNNMMTKDKSKKAVWYEKGIKDQVLADVLLDADGASIEKVMNLGVGMYRNGEFGSTVTDVYNNPNTGQQGWESANNTNYKKFVNDVNYYSEFRGKISAEEFKAVGGNKKILSELAIISKNISEIDSQILELEEQQSTAPEGQPIDNTAKIQELQTKKEALIPTIDYLIKEDGKTGKSKGYNDLMQMTMHQYIAPVSMAKFAYAKMFNKDMDKLTKKDLSTIEYRMLLSTAKSQVVNNFNVPNESRTIGENIDKARNEYSEYLNVLSSREAASVVDKAEASFKSLEQLSGEIGSLNQNDIVGYIERLKNELNSYGETSKRFGSVFYSDKMTGDATKSTKITELNKKASELTAGLMKSLGSMQATIPGVDGQMFNLSDSDNVSTAYNSNAANQNKYEDNQEPNIFDNYNSIDATKPFGAPVSEYNNKYDEYVKNNKDVDANLASIETEMQEVRNQMTKEAPRAKNKLGRAIQEVNKVINPSNRYNQLNKKLSELSKKAVEESAKRMDNPLYAIGNENEMRYFGAIVGDINDLSEQSAKGFKSNNLNPMEKLNQASELKRQLASLSRVIDFDFFGVSQMFKNGNASYARNSYHNNLTEKQRDDLRKRMVEYEKALNDVIDIAMNELGFGEHNVLPAIESRMRLAIFRDVYTNKNVQDALLAQATTEFGTEDIKNVLKKIEELVAYKNGKNKFDFDRIDMANTERLLTDEALKNTEELLLLINDIESVMNGKGREVFFSDAAVKSYAYALAENHYQLLSNDGAMRNPLESAEAYTNGSYNGYGYHNCRFEEASTNTTPIDLLKATVMQTSYGEVSLFSHDEPLKHDENKEGVTGMIKPTSYTNANEFAYKYAMNYITQLSVMTTNDVYEKHRKSLEDFGKGLINFPLTFEQTNADALVDAFHKGGNVIFNKLMISESEYFTEVFEKHHTNDKLNPNGKKKLSEYKTTVNNKVTFMIPNSIFVTGNYGVGKTELAPSLIENAIIDKLNSNSEITITVSANTTDLITKNVDNIKSYLDKKYKGNKVTIKVVNSRDIAKVAEESGDLLLIDEATLLPATHLRTIATKLQSLSGTKLIMLGDKFQMSEINAAPNSMALFTSLTTVPITVRYRSGLTQVNSVADYFMNKIGKTNGIDTTVSPLPDVTYMIDDKGNKLGIRYYKPVDGVNTASTENGVMAIVNEFIMDNTKNKKALIIPSVEHLSDPMYAALVKVNVDKKGNKTLVVKPEYKGKVRVIIDDLNKTSKSSLESIQGLAAEHLYIGFNWEKFIGLGENSGHGARMMYTSIGRSSISKDGNASYIAMVGNVNNNIPITNPDAAKLLTKVDNDVNRNTENEMKFVENIVNGTSRTVVGDEKTEQKKVNDINLGKTLTDLDNKKVKDGWILVEKTGNIISYVKRFGHYYEQISYNNLGKVIGSEIVYRSDYKSKTKNNKESKLSATFTFKKNSVGEVTNGQIYVNSKTLSLDRDKAIKLENSLKNKENISIGMYADDSFIKAADLKFDMSFELKDNPFIKSSIWNKIKEYFRPEMIIDKLKLDNASTVKVIYEDESANYYADVRFNQNDNVFEYSYDNFVSVEGSFEEDALVDLLYKTFKEDSSFKESGGMSVRNDIYQTQLMSFDMSKNSIQTPEGTTVSVGDDVGTEDKPAEVTAISDDNDIITSDVDGVNVMSIDDLPEIGTPREDFMEAVGSETAEQVNVKKNDKVKNNRRKTEFVNGGIMSLPIYSYGASTEFSVMDGLDNNQIETVRNAITIMKQNMLRSGMIDNMRYVARKSFRYIDDNGNVQTEQMAFLITGEVDFKRIGNEIMKIDSLLEGNKEAEMKAVVKYFEGRFVLSTTETLNMFDEYGKLRTKDNALKATEKLNSTNVQNDKASDIASSIIESIYTKVSDFEKSDATELELGNIDTVKPNEWHGLDSSLLDKVGYKEFIEMAKSRGFTLDKVARVSIGSDSKKQLAFIFSSGYGTTAIVYGMPQMVVDAKGYTDTMIKGLETITKTKDKKQRLAELNKSLFFRMINANKTMIIKNNLFPGLLSFDEKTGVKFNIPQGVSEADFITNKIIPFIKQYFSGKHKSYNEIRTPLMYNKADEKLVDDQQWVDFNVKGINATGFYFDYNSAIPQTNNRESRRNKFSAMVRTSSQGKRANILEFAEMFKRTLGDSYEDFMRFYDYGTMQDADGRFVAGYYNGMLNYEVDENGEVMFTTPKHEIAHYAWDKLNINDKNRLIRAGRMAYAEQHNLSLDEVNLIPEADIEHFIINDYTKRYPDPVYLKQNSLRGLLERFKRFVNKLFLVFADSEMLGFYESIENGKYANIWKENIEITDTIKAEIRDEDVIELDGDVDPDIANKVDADMSNDINKQYTDKHISKRTQILKKIGRSKNVYENMKYQVLGLIGSEWSVITKNGVSLKDSIQFFVDDNNQDLEKYANKKIVYDGQEYLVSEFPGYLVPKLKVGSLDYNNLVSYMVCDNSEFLIEEFLGIKNDMLQSRNYNDDSLSRKIDNYMNNSMLNMALANVPVVETSIDGKDHLPGNYLPASRVKQIIKDFSSDFQNDYETRGDMYESMIFVLNKNIENEFGDTQAINEYKGLVLFLNNIKNNQEASLTIKDKNGNPDPDIETYRDCQGLKNKLTGVIISTDNRVIVEARRNEKNDSVSLMKKSSDKVETLKDTYKAIVANRTMRNGMITNTLYDKFFNKDESKGKIRVDGNGLSFVDRYNNEIKLIENVNGEIRFSEEAKKNVIAVKDMFNNLGILLKEIHVGKFINYEDKQIRQLPYNYKVGNSQSYAAMLYFMVASAYQMAEHRKANEQLEKLDKKEDLDEYDSIYEFSMSKVVNDNKGLRDMSFGDFSNLKSQTTKFMSDFGMNINELDTVEMYQGFEDSNDVQSIPSYDKSYVKPADFFGVFRAIATVSAGMDIRSKKPYIRLTDGRKIASNGVLSQWTKLGKKGFALLSVVNGSTVNNLSIGELTEVANYTDVVTKQVPHISDVLNMVFEGFISSVKTSPKFLNMFMYDIAARMRIYNYKLESSSPLVRINEKETGTDVTIDKVAITDLYKSAMTNYYNAAVSGANRINEVLKLTGKSVLLNGKTHSENVQKLNDVLKYVKEGSEVYRNILADLTKDNDYIIDKKTGTFKVGRAISFDTHEIFNIANYEMLNKTKNADKAYSVLETILHQTYIDFTKNNIDLGYKAPDKNTSKVNWEGKGKYDYYFKDGKTYHYNPMYMSFYMIDTLQRTLVDRKMAGDFTSFDDPTMLSKRKMVPTSPVQTASFGRSANNRLNITKLNVMVVKSTESSSIVSTLKKQIGYKDSDGYTYISLLGRHIVELGLGGKFSGEHGATKKNLLAGINLKTGNNTQIKHAAKATSNTMWNQSLTLRNIEKTLLDQLSIEAKEATGMNYDFYSNLMDHYAKTKDIEKASNELFNDIIKLPESSTILNLVTSMITDDTAVKNGLTAYVPYGINEVSSKIGEYNDKFPTMTLSGDGLGFVTNLSQEVKGGDKIKLPTQIIAQMPELDTPKRKYSKEFNTKLVELRQLKIQRVKDQLSKAEAADTIEERNSVLNFLRKKALESSENMDGYSEINKILSNRQNSILLPNVWEKVLQVYRNYLKKEIFDINVPGVRSTIGPAHILTHFMTEDGNIWTLQDIESTFGMTITKHVEFTVKNGDEEIVFKPYKMKPSSYVEGENGEYTLVPADCVTANPLLKEKNMYADETLKSIYLFNVDGKIIDVQSLTTEQKVEKVFSIINGLLTGKITSVKGISADTLDTMDIVVDSETINKSYHPLFRNIIEQVKLKDKDAIKSAIAKFYDDFDESLMGVKIRIPYGKPGQGTSLKNVAFTADANDIHLDMGGARFDDGDNDGDEDNVHRLVKPEDENDRIAVLEYEASKIMFEAQMDPANRTKIDLLSDADPIRKKVVRGKRKAGNTVSTIQASSNAYSASSQAGKAIGLFANANSVLNEMRNLTKLPNVFMKFVLDSGESLSNNIGNWLQLALDSNKINGIQDLGVPEKAMPILTTMISFPIEGIDTIDKLNDYVVTFFTNRHIKRLLHLIESESKADRYPKNNNVIRIAKSAYSNANQAAVGITSEEVMNHEKEVMILTNKISLRWDAIAKFLKDTNNNKLWEYVKDKGKLEAIVKNIDDIESIKKDYQNNIDELNSANTNSEYWKKRNKVLDTYVDRMTEIAEDFESFDKTNLEGLLKGDVSSVARELYQIVFEAKNGQQSIYDMYVEIAKRKKVIDTYRKKNDYELFYRYAILSESNRRWSAFLQLKNFKETKSVDMDNKIHELETYIGMSLSELLDSNTPQNEVKYLNFYKRNSREYVEGEDQDLKELLEIEREIFNMFDIVAALRDPSQVKNKMLISVFNNNFLGKESPAIKDHQLMKFTLSKFKDTIFSIPKVGQRIAFEKLMNSMAVDMHFKTNKSVHDVDVYDYQVTSEGKVEVIKMNKPSLANLDMYYDRDRSVYLDQLPLFFEKVKEIADLGINNIVNVNNDDLSKLIQLANLMRTNGFLQKYVVGGRVNNRYLSFDSDANMSPGEKERLEQQFNLLPDWIKDMIFDYELARNVFVFRSGSAYDAIPSTMYHKVSEVMNRITGHLDSIFEDPTTREAFAERFIDNLVRNKEALNYRGSDVKIKNWRSESTKSQKLNPGDGGKVELGSAKYSYDFVNNGDFVFKVLVDANGASISSISRTTGAEFDQSKPITTRRQILQSLDTAVAINLYNDEIEGNMDNSYTMPYNVAPSFKKTTKFATRYGTPIMLAPMNGEFGTATMYKVYREDVQLETVEKDYKIEEVLDLNDKYVEKGGVAVMRGVYEANDLIPLLSQDNYIVSAFGNDFGYPLTGTVKALFGDDARTGRLNVKHDDGKITYETLSAKIGNDNVGKVVKGKTYQIPVVKAKSATFDKITNKVAIEYDDKHITDVEVKQSIKDFIQTVANTKDKIFVLANFDKDSTNRKVSINGESTVLTRQMLNQYLSDAIVEVGPQNLLNLRIVGKDANYINKNLTTAGLLKSNIVDGLKNLLDSNTLRIEKVLSETPGFNKNVLKSLKDRFGITNVNTVELAIGLSRYISDAKFTEFIDNNWDSDMFAKEKKFLGAEALYYISENKGFPLSMNAEGSSSVVYETIVNEIGDSEIAIRARAKLLQVDTQELIKNWSKNKSQVMGELVGTYDIQSLDIMVEQEIIERKCLGAAEGMQLGFTVGGQWELIKDLQGPSHAGGGINLNFSDDGVSFERNSESIKASNGLII